MTFVNPEPLALFADVIAAGEGEMLIPALAERDSRGRRIATICCAGSRRTRVLHSVVLRRALRRRRHDRGVRAEAGHRRAAGREEGRGEDHRPPRSAGDVDLHARHRVRIAIPDRSGARLREPVPLLLGRLQLPAGARLSRPIASSSSPPRRKQSLGKRRARVDRALRSSGDRAHPDAACSTWATRSARRRCASTTSPQPIVQLLRESGERSITIAPETGSDRLRRVINKTVTNAGDPRRDRADLRQRHREPEALLHDRPADRDRRRPGGDPRSDRRRCATIMMQHGKARGRVGRIVGSVNPLIPKPGTAYQWLPMEDPAVTDAQGQAAAAAAVGHRQRVLQHQVGAAFVLPGAALAGRSARGRRRSRRPSATAATGAPPSRRRASTRTSTSSATARRTPCCPGTSSTAA